MILVVQHKAVDGRRKRGLLQISHMDKISSVTRLAYEANLQTAEDGKKWRMATKDVSFVVSKPSQMTILTGKSVNGLLIYLGLNEKTGLCT